MLDASGKPVGALTMEDVTSAMVTPATFKSDAPAQMEQA
jgi:hypothetical protein